MEKSNNNEKLTKVGINWYPGHMAKTKQKMINDLKLVDIVIEVLDARIPISSQNSDLEKIMQSKKRIIVLNKADLADDNVTANWIKRFKENGVTAIPVEANNRKYAKKIIDVIKNESIEIANEYAKKGRNSKRIRAMVFGIPNVGKSTFINLLAGKNIVKSENRPGVTKANQWIKISDNIDLMDTPGMLWPKIDNEKAKLNLAFTNSIPENVIDNEEIAFYLLKFLVENYRSNLEKRYGIIIEENNDNNENFNSDLVNEKIKSSQGNNNNTNNFNGALINKEAKSNQGNNDEDENKNENKNGLFDSSAIIDVREKIALKTGARLSGGNIDEMKVSNIILNDFRSGKLGKISLEE